MFIETGLPSDHSIVNLELHTNKCNRGRGFCKFNNDLLHGKEFVELIKKTIIESKKTYNQYTDKCLVWELVKLKIRSTSIPYCINIRKI